MKFTKIDDSNFMMYAIKHYDNPQCKNMEEFYEDLSRIIYIKRLFNKYLNTGDLKEQLILNHIITFYNVFGIEAATRILFMKIDSKYYSLLKTFILYLNYIKPDHDYKEWGLELIPIPLELNIVSKLRKA
jgi:hypothetical protein